MKKNLLWLYSIVLLTIFMAAACQPPAAGTPTGVFVPTTTFTSTVTLSPTITPSPTPSPPPIVTEYIRVTVQGTPIPFETVDSKENPSADVFGGEYQGESPIILALTKVHDLAQIGGLSSEARDEISETNFDQYIIIVVFQGRKGTNGYGVDIHSVTLMDEQIFVNTELITPPTPPPVVALSDVETSPYQVIKIRKDGLKGTLRLQLVVDNQLVDQTEITIDQD